MSVATGGGATLVGCSMVLAVVMALVGAAAAEPAHAFQSVGVGQSVPNLELHTLAGKREKLFGKGEEAVVAFVFFDPAAENSVDGLSAVAARAVKLKDKSVRWVAVVSGSAARADVDAALAKTKFPGVVLVDKGDALYGAMGVVVTPTLGLADKTGALRAYQPFRRVGFGSFCEAQVLFALGEIDATERDKRLNPEAPTQDLHSDVARRYLKMAEKQIQSGKLDSARKSIAKARETAPEAPEAYGLEALILATEKKCDAAVVAAGVARAAKPDEPAAAKALALCQPPAPAPAPAVGAGPQTPAGPPAGPPAAAPPPAAPPQPAPAPQGP